MIVFDLFWCKIYQTPTHGISSLLTSYVYVTEKGPSKIKIELFYNINKCILYFMSSKHGTAERDIGIKDTAFRF